MNKGAWWAIGPWGLKSQTQLTDFHFYKYLDVHILKREKTEKVLIF